MFNISSLAIDVVHALDLRLNDCTAQQDSRTLPDSHERTCALAVDACAIDSQTNESAWYRLNQDYRTDSTVRTLQKPAPSDGRVDMSKAPKLPIDGFLDDSEHEQVSTISSQSLSPAEIEYLPHTHERNVLT